MSISGDGGANPGKLKQRLLKLPQSLFKLEGKITERDKVQEIINQVYSVVSPPSTVTYFNQIKLSNRFNKDHSYPKITENECPGKKEKNDDGRCRVCFCLKPHSRKSGSNNHSHLITKIAVMRKDRAACRRSVISQYSDNSRKQEGITMFFKV